MNDYPCRECPIREKCIDQSNLASRTKTMIQNAFAARTDTFAVGAVLQKNCLIESVEKPKRGTLMARMTQRQSVARRKIRPISRQKDRHTAGQVRKKTQIADPASASRPTVAANDDDVPAAQDLPEYFLIIGPSQRRIALPSAGSLVLGRFDPSTTGWPDIDLTSESRQLRTVSRRHAQITAVDNRHVIEDLSSANGVFVNGRRVAIGFHHPLKPGDHIMLGSLTLAYDQQKPGASSPAPSQTNSVRHYLLNTNTGRKIELTQSGTITIGRLGSVANHILCADLSSAGDFPASVSRRHASISWVEDIPFVQDLRSSNGTHLNGKRLAPSQAAALTPGDQLSLGGCVLVYDIGN